MKQLIVIVGPTAIGKTSLSIELAQHFNCEIVSADSRQFFKEMAIGTAKPTKAELLAAPHHFIDCISVTERYSAGTFENDAMDTLNKLFKSNDYAILVGGSGLYVDAICNGIDDIPFDLKIREELNQELTKFGIEKLQNELKEKDPVHYDAMNISNPQRIIRALEVCRLTSKPYSTFRNNEPKKRDFDIIKIGLNTDREIVYNRINQRVDLMMKEGLLEEVKSLEEFKEYNALNTVGYKELFSHLKGEISLEDAIESIKQNTRNFAKRQLTWFNKDKKTKWFQPGNLNEIIDYLDSKVKDN